MKKCAICGEKNPDGRSTYCSPMCARVAKWRKKHHRKCVECGNVLEGKRVTYCSEECNREHRRKENGYKTRLGDPMNCGLCGREIERYAPNALFCQGKCSGEYKCISCGVTKPDSEFYDYRGQHENGKFKTTCKACLKIKREKD